MHGLPVLFPYVALPAIDVQAFPKAVLATGESESRRDIEVVVLPFLEMLGPVGSHIHDVFAVRGVLAVDRILFRRIGRPHGAEVQAGQ